MNVWCASSGGHLSTHQVVTALKLARLEERVAHREVILPQLAATGVEGKEVRRRSGWIVRFGPADAADVPAYLAAGKHKTDAMRRVRFGLRERLRDGGGLGDADLARRHRGGVASRGAALWALVWGLAVAVFLPSTTACRSASGRGRRRAPRPGSPSRLAPSLAAGGALTTGSLTGWGLGACAGRRPADLRLRRLEPHPGASGLFEEQEFHVALDLERCSGAYNCWAVCPEACFDKRPEIHKVEIIARRALYPLRRLRRPVPAGRARLRDAGGTPRRARARAPLQAQPARPPRRAAKHRERLAASHNRACGRAHPNGEGEPHCASQMAGTRGARPCALTTAEATRYTAPQIETG